jgi:hypothetical protein
MAFSTNRFFPADPKWISEIAPVVEEKFKNDGYTTKAMQTGMLGADISITKGGVFKTISGMKTALKIKMTPEGNGFRAEASCGIFGLQAIPTVISMLFFWPVLLTQIWGMIKQSNLDDTAMTYIEEALIAANAFGHKPSNSILGDFCPTCGEETNGGNFCSNCGRNLKE